MTAPSGIGLGGGGGGGADAPGFMTRTGSGLWDLSGTQFIGHKIPQKLTNGDAENALCPSRFVNASSTRREYHIFGQYKYYTSSGRLQG